MTNPPVQVPEVPTVMASADELPDMLDAIIHKAWVPDAAQLPVAVPTTGFEPTVLMRPEEFEKPSPEVLAMVAAEKAVEAALEADASNTTLPEPALYDTAQSPAFDPNKAAALALIHSLPGVKLPVGTPSAPAPKRRITVPIDTRAVSAERPSLAERVEVQNAVRRGWWVSGLVLGGLAAIATAFAVLVFGTFESSSNQEESFAGSPRPPKHQVVQQQEDDGDEGAYEDEEEALAPLVVNKPKAAKKQRARPAAAKRTQPKEKASDLKRPNMGPEASAPAAAPAARPRPAPVAAKTADARHADEPADPPEDSDARLFDER